MNPTDYYSESLDQDLIAIPLSLMKISPEVKGVGL